MTLNFPDSPSTGDIYDDSTSGFQYEWNGTVWISTDPQRAANIKELDDISGSFNGSTTQFNLRVSSSAVEPVSDAQILISVGGVMQNPTNDYTVSGSTITFTTAPSAGLTFFGVFLGQALSLNTVQDGTVSNSSFKAGTAGVGIQSGGVAIGVGITQINFIGIGNTLVSIGNTVNVSIASSTVGINTLNTSYFKDIVATGNLNVTGDLVYDEERVVNSIVSGTSTITNSNATQLLVSAGSTFNGDVDLGNATSDTITATGRFDSDLIPSTDGAKDLGSSSLEWQDLHIDGTANIDSLAADTAAIGDLTSGRVTYAGSSGELQDNAGLTFDGTTLASTRLAAPVAFTTSLTAANVDVTGITTIRDDLTLKGAAANITFDKSTDDLIFDDNAQAIFGTGLDLKIRHDGTTGIIDNTDGNLSIRIGGENVLLAVPNVGVTLYYDDQSKINTTSVGVNVVGNVDCDSLNNAGITTFTGAATLNGNTTFGADVTFGGASSATALVWDKSVDDLIFADGTKAVFGTSSDGVEIFHDGSNSRIKDTGTGALKLSGSEIAFENAATNETMAQFVENAGVSLRYDNTERFQTKGDGINVTGNVDCDSLNNAGISTFTGAASFAGDATFSSGAGAVTIAANSDIVIENGTWTGNSTTPRIQAHDNALYISGGSGGIRFRYNAGDRWKIDSDGHFIPSTDSTYDLGLTGTRIRNVYADTVYGDGSNMTGVGASLAAWNYQPPLYGSDVSQTITGIGITYSTFINAGSGSITLRETNASGTSVQTWTNSQISRDGNKFTGTLDDSLKQDQLYHLDIPAGFFTDPNGSNSVGIAYTFNTSPQFYTLYTWGDNTNMAKGNLGHNNETRYSSPTQVPGTSWQAVSQGSNQHVLATKNDGTFWSWGKNAYGQLGLNNRTYTSSPQQIPGTTWGTDVTQFSSATFLTLAVRTDGTLWSCGRNEHGQLGQGNRTTYSSPRQVGSDTTWRSVGTSHYSSYATKTDGTLWSWGENVRGKLGQSNNTAYSSPRQIPGTTWSTVSGRGGTTAVGAIKTDGTLWVWGDDDDGTLGLGQRDQHSSSPRQLAGTTWSALAGGYRVFWASKTDGSLWTWGQNSKGQLANNLPSNNLRSSPTQIPGETWATGQASLSGNMNGAMCLRTGNKMFMWGEGGAGELGQNATDHVSSPVQVPGTQWVQAARWRDCSAGVKNTLL